MTQRKAKSPYQKYGKTPFRYSDLRGVAHQRMLVQRFGADYWTVRNADGTQVKDRYGRPIPMFPADAYRSTHRDAA